MSEIELKINEKKIPLNDLMEEMLENLLKGYIKSAKGIPDKIETIEVKIQQ
ncbi:MAG: hypothetical protein ACOC44_14800 [Promethearchaeia archaeon]